MLWLQEDPARSSRPLKEDVMDEKEWKARCLKQIVEKTGIGLSLAYDVTESCYEEYYKDFKDNPEGCADEELAYWYK